MKKKLVSQSTKKAMKNRAALPRTAGLRTLSELTTEMTKAGLDPSRIQERAEMRAKVAGAKRKRQREEEEAQMDVDEDAEAEEDAEGEEADDIDIVGDGTHDDEGVVDDKDVVEEDVEDELIDVRPPATLHECARLQC